MSDHRPVCRSPSREGFCLSSDNMSRCKRSRYSVHNRLQYTIIPKVSLKMWAYNCFDGTQIWTATFKSKQVGCLVYPCVSYSIWHGSISNTQGEIILCTFVGSTQFMNKWIHLVFLPPYLTTLPSVALGKKTPIDILTCKIQQYQRHRVDVFWTPHQAHKNLRVGANPRSTYLIFPKTCFNYLSSSMAFRKSKCVQSDTKHTTMPIRLTGSSF